MQRISFYVGNLPLPCPVAHALRVNVGYRDRALTDGHIPSAALSVPQPVQLTQVTPEECGTLLSSANSAFMLGPAGAEGLRSAGRSSRLPGPPGGGGGGGGGGPPLEPEPFFTAAGALAALAAPLAAMQQWEGPYNVAHKVEGTAYHRTKPLRRAFCQVPDISRSAI